MAKRERLFVCKLEMTYNRQKLIKGQLAKPVGGRNDKIMFGENTHWFTEFHGNPVLCDTDGCPDRFADDHSLARHRKQEHAAERDYRERRKLEQKAEMAKMEHEGDTIGGHPVEKVVKGPGGPVEYITTK